MVAVARGGPAPRAGPAAEKTRAPSYPGVGIRPSGRTCAQTVEHSDDVERRPRPRPRSGAPAAATVRRASRRMPAARRPPRRSRPAPDGSGIGRGGVNRAAAAESGVDGHLDRGGGREGAEARPRRRVPGDRQHRDGRGVDRRSSRRPSQPPASARSARLNGIAPKRPCIVTRSVKGRRFLPGRSRGGSGDRRGNPPRASAPRRGTAPARATENAPMASASERSVLLEPGAGGGEGVLSAPPPVVRLRARPAAGAGVHGEGAAAGRIVHHELHAAHHERHHIAAE